MNLLPGEPSPHEPSPLVRAGGHLLLWTIAALVCYAAALPVNWM